MNLNDDQTGDSNRQVGNEGRVESDNTCVTNDNQILQKRLTMVGLQAIIARRWLWAVYYRKQEWIK